MFTKLTQKCIMLHILIHYSKHAREYKNKKNAIIFKDFFFSYYCNPFFSKLNFNALKIS